MTSIFDPCEHVAFSGFTKNAWEMDGNGQNENFFLKTFIKWVRFWDENLNFLVP